MKILIVEDESLGYERLAKLLQSTEYDIEICGHVVSIRSAVQWLSTQPAPDLIFMDIELADGQCFEIFQQVPVTSPIIFTTSYDEYALHAFKVNSVDYLLKPIRKEELEASLNKLQRLQHHYTLSGLPDKLTHLIHELKPLQTKPYRRRFLVKQGQRLLSVEVSDIAWFRAEGKLCFIRTWENQRFLIDHTLEELGQMLDPDEFFRINRSYIVHIRAIKQIHTYFKGKLLLRLQPPSEDNDVVVSKEKASEFKHWLGK